MDCEMGVFWSPLIANEKGTMVEMLRGENTTLKAEVGGFCRGGGVPRNRELPGDLLAGIGQGLTEIGEKAWVTWRRAINSTSIRLSHHDISVNQEGEYELAFLNMPT